MSINISDFKYINDNLLLIITCKREIPNLNLNYRLLVLFGQCPVFADYKIKQKKP